MSQSSNFQVLFGNEDRLNYNSMYSNIPVQLGNTQLFFDFFVLLISGTKVISGIQWLKTLGSILMNYNNLTMQFKWQSNHINLQGITIAKTEEVSSSQLKRMHAINFIAAFYLLELSNVSSNSSPTLFSSPSIILPILQEFEVLL